MRDYFAATHTHPLVEHYRLWVVRDAAGDHAVSTSVRLLNDAAYLSTILSPDKRAGHASTVLRSLCDLADQHHVVLTLLPTPIGKGGLSKSDLVKWYRRHGFRIAHRGLSEMRRDPRAASGG